MGAKPPITPFRADPDVRPDEPKWLILKRDSPHDPWVVFANHTHGTPYRYATMDLATKALKSTFYKRWRVGNARIEREDRIEAS